MDISSETYGKKNVKKNLGHFILGKSLSLIVGLGFFLIIARALNIEEFSFYIILVALLEIIGMVSNFGSYYIAQRYVPELMHQRAYVELKKLLMFLLAFRTLTLVIFLVLLFWLSEYVLGYFDVVQYLWVLQLYLLVVFFENLSRFIEMTFDSLLLQGYTQISILFRTILRFVIVLALYLYSVENTIDLNSLIFIEFITGLLGVLVVLMLLTRFVLHLPKHQCSDIVNLDYIRYFNFARPGYVAQIIGLTYSVDALKFVMLKVFGSLETALFGFTSTLIGMLSRYMPSVLLMGMIRPILITAYSEGDGFSRLHQLTFIMIKINLMFILPIIVFLAVLSEELVLTLAGDKFEGAGSYLFLFSVLMLFQIFHMILSHLNMANEGGKVLLKAAFLSACGTIIGLMLIPFLGQYAVIFGLILSEILFCTTIYQNLARFNVINLSKFRGLSSFLFATVFCLSAIALFDMWMGGEGLVYLSVMLFLTFAVCLFSLYILKPFTAEERKLINRVLPLPVFIF